MKNKSLITAISIPKNVDGLLTTIQKKKSISRSQLIREMVNFYTKNQKNSSLGIGESIQNYNIIDDQQPDRILKLYYQLISNQSSKPTLVIGIGIVNKKEKVLIGLRKKTDNYIKHLNWTFPSGKFTSLDFEKEIIKTIKSETGYVTKVNNLIHARLIPDTPQKKIRIVALYYHCKIIEGKQTTGGDFKELKWITATEVCRYFTTSTCDEIIKFLGTLH